MTLKDREWKEFLIEDLFDVTIGKNVDANKIDKSGGNIAYITRKESNNGLDGFICYKKDFINSCHPVITIGNETAEPFIQDYPFFTGTKVNILKSKIFLSKDILRFICISLKCHKNKYSYSYTINSTRIKRQKILLPITSLGKPDYKYMEDYVKLLEEQKEKQYLDYITKRIENLKGIKAPLPLKDKEWCTFKVIDIFTKVQRGKRLKKGDHKLGNTPYASSTALNNGIDGYIGNKNNVRVFEKCLTLANSGSVGATHYHPYRFIASDHVTKLENDKFDKYIYLFISSIIKRLEEKYSFNREINDIRLKKEKIMLPVNSDKQPDYKYMEQYMKYLEYKKLNTYLEFKKKKI